MATHMDRLSQMLLKHEIVTQEQLDQAFEKQQESGKSLGRILLELGFVKENTLAELIAKELGHEYVELLEYKINIHATSLIDEAMARRYMCIPIDFDDGRLVVAMADPTNIYALDDIRLSTGNEVKAVVSAREDVLAAIQRYYHLDTDVVEEALNATGDDDSGHRGHQGTGGRRPHRAVHQPPDHRGHQPGGVGHPHRPAGGPHPGPLPD